MKNKETCFVCISPFNKNSKKQIICNNLTCNFNICVECASKYICGIHENPHCMNCKMEWNRELLEKNFTKKFLNTTYKKYRESILFEREKSMFPDTLGDVEEYIRILEYKKKIKCNKNIFNYKKKEYDAIKTYIRTTRTEMLNLNEDLRLLEIEMEVCKINIKFDKKQIDAFSMFKYNNAEKKIFIKACPKEGCKGFLSTAWKCGLCHIWVCPDCHEIKGKDKNIEHICNQEILNSVKLINLETKNCPKCVTKIYKIDGCFAKNTPVLMFDKSIKNSQDIIKGDVLLGDDNNKRIVEDVCTGFDDLYEIKQNEGMTYIVNSKHELVLINIIDNKIIYITVEQYISLSENIKEKLFGIIGDDNNEKKILSNIIVTKIERNRYYGWRLNDNKRFYLSDYTVVKNCNQMFCTQCHTAFDWRTGKVDNGQIHNPHYYDYLNNLNVANRNINLCFNNDLINLIYIKNNINRILKNSKEVFIYKGNNLYNRNNYETKISDIHRSHGHITNVELFTINPVIDNKQLRMDYLVNNIDEKKFKIILQRREKANEKKNEINMILRTYLDIVKDLLNSTMEFNTIKELTEFDRSVEQIRNYINDSLIKISKRYNCVVIQINDYYGCYTRKKF